MAYTPFKRKTATGEKIHILHGPGEKSLCGLVSAEQVAISMEDGSGAVLDSLDDLNCNKCLGSLAKNDPEALTPELEKRAETMKPAGRPPKAEDEKSKSKPKKKAGRPKKEVAAAAAAPVEAGTNGASDLHGLVDKVTLIGKDDEASEVLTGILREWSGV